MLELYLGLNNPRFQLCNTYCAARGQEEELPPVAPNKSAPSYPCGWLSDELWLAHQYRFHRRKQRSLFAKSRYSTLGKGYTRPVVSSFQHRLLYEQMEYPFALPQLARILETRQANRFFALSVLLRMYVVSENGTKQAFREVDTLKAMPLPDAPIIVPSCYRCHAFCLLSFLDYFKVTPGIDIIGRDSAAPRGNAGSYSIQQGPGWHP